MKADDIRAHMKREYTRRESAIVFEVPNGLGFDKPSRFCDAIVCNMWRSRGYEMEGFEIKVSRSDWLHELQLPAKAESHFERCDRWWLITPAGAAVARPEEIPRVWGWMTVSDKGDFRIARKAPKIVPSKKFDQQFAFALVRAAARYDDKAVTARVAAGIAKHAEDFTARVNAQAAQLAAGGKGDGQYAKLTAKLQEAFGRDLCWMANQEVVDTIQAVFAMRKATRYTGLEGVVGKLRAAAEAVAAAEDAIDKARQITQKEKAA